MAQMGQFDKAIVSLIEGEQDQKLWEMYLHSMSDKPFNEWKKKALEKAPDRAEPMTKEQVTTEINKSKEILKCFN